LTEEAAKLLPGNIEVVDLDATQPDDIETIRAHIAAQWGHLDGVLHAIAFAPREALAGDLLAASPENVNLAFNSSTFSYAALGKLLRDLAPASGGSLVGLDFDAAGAWPVYNWMGVCKAALESVNRYLARDLGQIGGPVKPDRGRSVDYPGSFRDSLIPDPSRVVDGSDGIRGIEPHPEGGP